VAQPEKNIYDNAHKIQQLRRGKTAGIFSEERNMDKIYVKAEKSLLNKCNKDKRLSVCFMKAITKRSTVSADLR